ncbi:hypothetical protein Sta7437_0656 [Stanieria cyanosphaera PCC 7437]|uniref:Uncharacterized protein n=1 Tax=Stanieria cyanosphaera (strain ATCC 29371 / PCC 7437) TaxID=111780 RepID=K9XQC1_STAC7|nr:hypothetical protein [Stanieria cyanosphaera]AFZ34251.1 hypothetical protein Sta7437_0656 [Stanieria cyanosphaera PCC 7437]
MKKHYLLHLNPHASHEWDRCVLRNPLTGERPDLVEEISQAVAKGAGSYLISVSIDVEVLEQVPLSSNSLKTKEISPTKTTITTVESTRLLAS